VGLELKRELIAGRLSSVRDGALPIFAAAGGMPAPSIDFIISRLVKVGARVVCHTSRGVGYAHVASAFPLTRYYRILFA